MILFIVYIQNEDPSGWRTVNGFSVDITGDIEQIEEFYTHLEDRLLGYSDWFNIILTGELSDFQKNYAPFRILDKKFDNFLSISSE